MKSALIEFYLDWVNNFLTIKRMAEYYDITETHCIQLVDLGRYYHELNKSIQTND